LIELSPILQPDNNRAANTAALPLNGNRYVIMIFGQHFVMLKTPSGLMDFVSVVGPNYLIGFFRFF